MTNQSVINIAIFATGGGSNALKIMEHFRNHPTIKVVLVVSNKREAGVLKVAEYFGVETLIVSKSTFYETENILTSLEDYKISFIVLAGFLLLVPNYIIKKYHKKIVNIHPALLPKFGGKGMYGYHVHEAVRAANETETGITIHYANEHYDEGDILFQARCPVLPTDSPDDIARNVLKLEHENYAKVIEEILTESKI
jgi:phosphoribosylglycinamide formyltransferase 1